MSRTRAFRHVLVSSLPVLLAAGGSHVQAGNAGRVFPVGGLRAQAVQQGELLGSREYAGDPVSMEFQNAELRSVLRTFAEISGLNLVIDRR